MTASQLSSAAWCHCKQAAPLQLCFCHKSFFLLVWYPRLPSNEVATTLQLTDFFARFGRQEMILARNIDCRSKTLKQFGPVASKYERKSRYKSIFQCISLRRQVCVCRPIWFSRVFCSVWLFTVETSSCFLKSSLEFNSHRGQPKCIGVLVSSPIDQSFCSVLRPRNNNLQANCTVVVVVFFFFTYGRRHNAKYAF